MAITYESLRAFVRKVGFDLNLFAPNKGELRILKDGTADVFDIIDKATIFSFGGKEYSREEFDKLLNREIPE
jgi:hypothetical protein